MQTVITLVIFGVIAAILLGLSYWLGRSGLRGVLSARASQAWPSTSGRVLLVQAIKMKDVGLSTSQRHQTDYRPVVQCSYTVGNKTYGCEHRRFNDDVIVYSTIEKARTAVSNYQVGQTVRVYYDPANPSQSVLEPGIAGPAWRELSSGILCFLLALMPIIAMLAFIKDLFN